MIEPAALRRILTLDVAAFRCNPGHRAPGASDPCLACQHGAEALVSRIIAALGPEPTTPRELGIRLDSERLAVVAAARRFLFAHDTVVESDPVTRDDTFAMKRAADILRVVLIEYDAALAVSRAGGGRT